MDINDFSAQFDVLLNSYSKQSSFGNTQNLSDIRLDEYEKSVFLTKAQEDIILELYSGRNDYKDSFEKTEELRRYLSSLVKTYETTDKVDEESLGISSKSIFFSIPEDVWFITYESAIFKDDKLECLNGTTALVTPVTQDEFYKISNNPFRGPSEKRVLRLDIKDNKVELVSDYIIDKYIMRYLSKPSPIILVNLGEDLNINGVNVVTECTLDSSLHRIILERAVKLAIISKSQLVSNKE